MNASDKPALDPRVIESLPEEQRQMVEDISKHLGSCVTMQASDGTAVKVRLNKGQYGSGAPYFEAFLGGKWKRVG